MVLGWGIGIAVAITIVMIFLRIFFKSVYKIISIIWLVLFLATIGFTIIIYADARDIQTNFANGSNIFILEVEDELLAGFVTRGEMEPKIFEGLDEIQELYNAEDYDGMLESGEYYKMFIVNEKSFDNVNGIELDEFNISTEEAFDVIKSDDAVEEYAELLRKRNYSDEGTESEDSTKVRGILFALLFFAGNVEEGPLFIINNFKNGNIQIYEETIVFKLIKYFPASLMDEVISKMEMQEKEVS